MQFVREYDIIQKDIMDKISNLVYNDKREFKTSELYSSSLNKKFIDNDKRESVYKQFINKKLFDLMDILINNINKNENELQFNLVRNDITFIKYKKGI